MTGNGGDVYTHTHILDGGEWHAREVEGKELEIKQSVREGAIWTRTWSLYVIQTYHSLGVEHSQQIYKMCLKALRHGCLRNSQNSMLLRWSRKSNERQEGNWTQCHSEELSVRIKCSMPVLSNTAISHVWLLSIWDGASMTEKLNY